MTYNVVFAFLWSMPYPSKSFKIKFVLLKVVVNYLLTMDVELVPQQANQICAVEPRFCLSHPVTLKLKEKIWSFSGDDIKIADANTGVIYFQCKGKVFSISDKKTLMDNTGSPVLNIKESMFSSNRYRIYAGNDSERQIFKIKVHSTWTKAKLSTQFNDAVSGKPWHLVIKSDRRQRHATIYIGEPKQGGIPIATINRAYTYVADEYLVEIVPGVDISLIVCMCIALDEQREGKSN